MAAPAESVSRADPAALGALLAGRFRVRSQLGAGGFGAVYAAEDERDGSIVALKRLTRATGANVYRFKREFRTLTDQRHPNLVRLYELFSEADEWFFTMELIAGERFDKWLLGDQASSDTMSTVEDRVVGSGAVRREAFRGADLTRLRPALVQLVAGIQALHALGVVHRDLKPANVLVTGDGRVVILDFGLVADADPDEQKSTVGVVLGTPTYMAPEQALGRITTPAADWYALGVMLFEVLHGRPPFVGTADEVLAAKLSPDGLKKAEGRHPDPAAESAAPDLEELCRALLVPDPDARPDGDTIARIVAADAAGASMPVERTEVRAPFVGRTRELAELRDALATTTRGKTVVVRVRGRSGVGKTALVREFADNLGPDAVLLEGRCYERESVPYKALDGVVDSLTRTIGRLSVAEARLLVPRESQALCRLFPVFSRLQLIADQPGRLRSLSPHEERRRGFMALREVFARIADRRPLVVIIDDLQWGDIDSVEPLRGLLAPPDAPPLLLVLVSRAEDEDASPMLAALRETPFILESDCPVRVVDVAPLDGEDALVLAQSLLPPGEKHRAQTIAVESRGLPFFVPELVRAHNRLQDAGEPLSLDVVVRRRAAELSGPVRRILQVVAVAGRPVPRDVACEAAGVEEGGAAAVDELLREHFLRSASGEDGLLETFHDRVRETVVASLQADERRALHAALATALMNNKDADPETLAEHYRAAGDVARARPAEIAAAERATEAFAFARAIHLYRSARVDAPSHERRLLTTRLADVLAYAGRNREAAAAYLEAIEGAPQAEQPELRRRAAELLLRCGAISEGIALARELLAEAKLPWPESQRAVLASVIAQKLRLMARGYGFKERGLGPEDDEARRRVDLCWTLGATFSPLDFLRATEYQTRHLRLALDLGDPYRIARGFSLEAVLLSVEGGRGLRRAEKLANRAREIATRIDDPHAIGWALASLAIHDFGCARWRRTVERVDEAFGVLRARAPEGVWELSLVEIWFKNRSLLYLGELERFADASTRSTRSAAERGDELALKTAQAVCEAQVLLVRDKPAEARTLSANGIPTWTKDAWHFPHQENLRTSVQCDVYEDEAPRALARIDEHWSRLKRSLLLRAVNERILSGSTFANVALHARDKEATRRWLSLLERQEGAWAHALTAGVRAGAMALNGDDGAAAAYERAAAAFDALEMLPFASAARRRMGELLGGSEGAAIVSDVDRVLRARGVVRPERWTKMFVA